MTDSGNWKQVLENPKGKPWTWLSISLVDLVEGMSPGR